MTKEKFSQLLLSRFLALDHDDRYDLIRMLVLADSELSQNDEVKERVEDTEDFVGWAAAIQEVLLDGPFEILEMDMDGSKNDQEEDT